MKEKRGEVAAHIHALNDEINALRSESESGIFRRLCQTKKLDKIKGKPSYNKSQLERDQSFESTLLSSSTGENKKQKQQLTYFPPEVLANVALRRRRRRSPDPEKILVLDSARGDEVNISPVKASSPIENAFSQAVLKEVQASKDEVESGGVGYSMACRSVRSMKPRNSTGVPRRAVLDLRSFPECNGVRNSEKDELELKGKPRKKRSMKKSAMQKPQKNREMVKSINDLDDNSDQGIEFNSNGERILKRVHRA